MDTNECMKSTGELHGSLGSRTRGRELMHDGLQCFITENSACVRVISLLGSAQPLRETEETRDGPQDELKHRVHLPG